MDPLDIGIRIRDARIRMGRTNAAQFARDVGIQPHTLWRYEAGQTRPGVEATAALAKELKVSMEWILTGEGRGPEPESSEAV